MTQEMITFVKDYLDQSEVQTAHVVLSSGLRLNGFIMHLENDTLWFAETLKNNQNEFSLHDDMAVNINHIIGLRFEGPIN